MIVCMTHLHIVFAFFLAASLTASADTKPKYGPEATLLSQSHEYVQHHPAPEYWAMMPYYTAQQTGAACSIAAISMVVNAARSGAKLTADDELATQNNVLKKSRRRRMDPSRER